jgi:hypothetical protein
MQTESNLFTTSYFSKIDKKIIAALFVLLWTFLFIRAIYVPVLHDEIATFFYYIQSDNYLPPKAHWDANNHVLNSFLSNISYHLFGSSPLALRLPNVLSYGIFFLFVFRIAGRLKTSFLRWGFLLALTCSHYLFEYFGECRGYGMSMALLMAALYYFLRIIDTKKRVYYFLTALSLFLATSANLTLILPAVLIFASLFVHLLFTYFPKQKIRFFIDSFLLGILGAPFLILAKQSFILREKGALYYGGDNGFYEITVKSLSTYYTDIYSTPIAIGITMIFCGIFVFLIAGMIRKRSITLLLSSHYFFGILLVGNVVCILLVSHLLKVNFPEDRAAMHLYLLFIGGFIFTLDQLTERFKKSYLLGGLVFYFPLIFILHLSIRNSVFSSEERTSFAFFDYVSASERSFKFPATVGGYKTQEFCWYYLNSQAGGHEAKIQTNYHIALDADFQVVRDGRIEDSILFDYYTPILNDPATHLTLFERKKKLPKKLVLEQNVVPTTGIIADEYHNILEMEVDSFLNKTMYIGAEMTLMAESKPFVAWLAVTVNDSSGNSLYQEYIALDWLRKNWDGKENNLLQGTLLHNIPAGSKTLKFYIWNIEKTKYSIPNGKCYLYDLERDFTPQYD